MIRASVSPHGWPNLRGLPRRADPPAEFVAFFGRRRLRGSISPVAVDSLAAAIQTQEGYYPGSLAYQNNNPGNLVYAGQPGATQGAGGFAAFSSYPLGLAALKNQINLDATRGTDINGNPTTTAAELLTSWAPPSENDTAAYIASVSVQTGYDPNAPLSSLGTPSLLTLPDNTVGTSDSSISFPSLDADFSSVIDSTVDLSSVGIGAVSVPLLVGAGLVGALVIAKLF